MSFQALSLIAKLKLSNKERRKNLARKKISTSSCTSKKNRYHSVQVKFLKKIKIQKENCCMKVPAENFHGKV